MARSPRFSIENGWETKHLKFILLCPVGERKEAKFRKEDLSLQDHRPARKGHLSHKSFQTALLGGTHARLSSHSEQPGSRGRTQESLLPHVGSLPNLFLRQLCRQAAVLCLGDTVTKLLSGALYLFVLNQDKAGPVSLCPYSHLRQAAT